MEVVGAKELMNRRRSTLLVVSEAKHRHDLFVDAGPMGQDGRELLGDPAGQEVP